MQDRPIYSILMMAGAFPFLACALLPVAGVESLAIVGDLDTLAALYGVAILSFLAGIHWATQLYLAGSVPTNLFIVSNVVFIVVLLAFVAANLGIAIITQLIAFPLLLAIDYTLARRGLLTTHYLRLRVIVTVVAWLSLAFNLVGL